METRVHSIRKIKALKRSELRGKVQNNTSKPTDNGEVSEKTAALDHSSVKREEEKKGGGKLWFVIRKVQNGSDGRRDDRSENTRWQRRRRRRGRGGSEGHFRPDRQRSTCRNINAYHLLS